MDMLWLAQWVIRTPIMIPFDGTHIYFSCYSQSHSITAMLLSQDIKKNIEDSDIPLESIMMM